MRSIELYFQGQDLSYFKSLNDNQKIILSHLSDGEHINESTILSDLIATMELTKSFTDGQVIDFISAPGYKDHAFILEFIHGFCLTLYVDRLPRYLVSLEQFREFIRINAGKRVVICKKYAHINNIKLLEWLFMLNRGQREILSHAIKQGLYSDESNFLHLLSNLVRKKIIFPAYLNQDNHKSLAHQFVTAKNIYSF